MYSLSVILQLIVVQCDYIFVLHVSFVRVVCDQLLCAVTDLCGICVLITMLIVILSAKYCIIVYRNRSECDQVGDMYCANCDNVSEVL